MSMFRNQLLGGALVLALVSGCDNDPAKDKTKVQAAAPEPAAPAAAPAASLVKYRFSQEDSSVEYVGAKVTGKHDGKFEEFHGTIDYVDGDVTKSKVEVEIKMASVTSDNDQLTGHLKSADFFDVEKFPTATFESTAISVGGADGATHTVKGNLTLHGEKKSIEFPAKIDASGDKLSIEAEFAINRKDFGIVYPGKPDDLIKDDVLLKLKLSPKKAE